MDEKKEKKESIFSKIKKVKHIEIIIAVIAVAVMLIIYFAGFGGSGGKTNESAAEVEFYSDYCQRMQAELTELVAKMEGAGESKVLINWESSVELILAETQNNSSNSSSNSPVIITNSGSSQPVVTKEIYPKALGAVVVCQGGADAKLKVNIIMSVSVLLELEPEKILVCVMRK